MVRDEADIVAAMVEHHLDQGLDKLIVTDNGSVDGTREILADYAANGHIELFDDPEHRKQQHAVVTRMARRARTDYQADWVLNLDADEFLIPKDHSMTVRECLDGTPLHLNAFTVPVVNLVGPAAWSGGLGLLTWRDHRSDEELQSIGIYAQPTPNAVHRGESDITVAQGNHFVSLKSNGQPPDEMAMEVMHLPWRSWAQLEQKVINAGTAYENSPHLRPSPNHHGMKDYRRYRAGWLENAYLARTPQLADLEAGSSEGSFERDDWLITHLRELVDRAIHPEHLAPIVAADADRAVPPERHADGAREGRKLLDEELQQAAWDQSRKKSA